MLCLENLQPTPLAFNSGPNKACSTSIQSNQERHPQGLQIIHDIAQWWQRIQIGRQCRYTARMMKRLGCFEEQITEYLRDHTHSKSIDEICAQFLATLVNHKDPVLRAVARLELACLQPIDPFTPLGSRSRVITIYWDRNPNQVMDALDRFAELPEPEPRVRYVLRLCADLPNGVTCVRQALRS